MTLSGFYLGLSIFNAIAVLCALIKARRLFFMLPVYFMLAWPVGEMAFILLGYQLALTVVVGFFGGLVSAGGQLGLLLFALSWMGMLYLHRQSMDSAGILWGALKTGLGEDYRQQIPQSRRQVLRIILNRVSGGDPSRCPGPAWWCIVTCPMAMPASATCWMFISQPHRVRVAARSYCKCTVAPG